MNYRGKWRRTERFSVAHGHHITTSEDTKMSKTYHVEGMTCEHCVKSVTEEIFEVPGVEDVTVELESGRVTVTGENLTDSAIVEAVNEAGYTVVDD